MQRKDTAIATLRIRLRRSWRETILAASCRRPANATENKPRKNMTKLSPNV